MSDPSARPAQGNLFASLPDAGDGERFDTLFANAACRVERIVSCGHASPPGFWYEQDEDEWVVLLVGSAVLAFADGRVLALRAGDWKYLRVDGHDYLFNIPRRRARARQPGHAGARAAGRAARRLGGLGRIHAADTTRRGYSAKDMPQR